MKILPALVSLLVLSAPHYAFSAGPNRFLPPIESRVVRIDGLVFDGPDNFRDMKSLMNSARRRVASGMPIARKMPVNQDRFGDIQRRGCVPEHTLSIGSGSMMHEFVFGRIQANFNIEKAFNGNGFALSKADRQGRFFISTTNSKGRSTFVLLDKVSGKILSISLKIP